MTTRDLGAGLWSCSRLGQGGAYCRELGLQAGNMPLQLGLGRCGRRLRLVAQQLLHPCLYKFLYCEGSEF